MVEDESRYKVQVLLLGFYGNYSNEHYCAGHREESVLHSVSSHRLGSSSAWLQPHVTPMFFLNIVTRVSLVLFSSCGLLVLCTYRSCWQRNNSNNQQPLSICSQSHPAALVSSTKWPMKQVLVMVDICFAGFSRVEQASWLDYYSPFGTIDQVQYYFQEWSFSTTHTMASHGVWDGALAATGWDELLISQWATEGSQFGLQPHMKETCQELDDVTDND